MLPRLALTLALTLFVCPFASASQPEPSADPPAHVSLVEGTATLEREGRAENPLNMPLLSGDRLKTADGRVEVLFADGSTLHLDRSTTIDVQSDVLVRLINGRVRLNILSRTRPVDYRVDSPSGSARITQPGEYRLAILHASTGPGAGDRDEAQLELAVLRGAAEIFTEQGTTPVRAGERAYASAGLAPSYAYAYNSANWDAFDRWSEGRRDARLGVSAQYLPSEVQSYASTFDESGDWRYAQPYGYVWYPRVAVGWRPYYYGRWVAYPRYGWTWVGVDRFAWPTHHYGRWGFSANAWFWIPANRWAPHYVSWSYAGNYVGWCPLGFNNLPLISVNFFYGPRYGHHYPAWTSVSRSHFGHGWVHHRAVNWDRVDWNRRPGFRLANTAPVNPNIAVPRGSSVPVRWAGAVTGNGSRAPLDGQAVPRGSGARDRALSSSGSRAPLPGSRAPLDGSRAVTRGDGGSSSPAGSPGARTAPRYVNRGDEIVRSQTERPMPRTATRTSVPENIAVPRGSSSGNGGSSPAIRTGIRTVPSGPARRLDETPQFDRGARAVERTPSSSIDRASPSSIDRGRQAVERTPSFGRTSPPAMQRSPGTIDRAPQTIDRGPSFGRTAPNGIGGGAPSYDRAVPRTIERGPAGGGARMVQPSYGERQSAPAPRAYDGSGARAPRQAGPPPSQGGGERAAPATRAPSGGNTAVPRRGGRGGGA